MSIISRSKIKEFCETIIVFFHKQVDKTKLQILKITNKTPHSQKKMNNTPKKKKRIIQSKLATTLTNNDFCR